MNSTLTTKTQEAHSLPDYIAKEMDRKAITSIRRLALLTGVTEGALRHNFSNPGSMSLVTAMRLAELFGVSVEKLAHRANLITQA